MLSRQKRELFKRAGRSTVAFEGDDEQPQNGPTNSNEDSGLSARSVESPPALPNSSLPPRPPPMASNSSSSARNGQNCMGAKPTVALLDAQQWAQLNEQIKQICLDCSKKFGDTKEQQTQRDWAQTMPTSSSRALLNRSSAGQTLAVAASESNSQLSVQVPQSPQQQQWPAKKPSSSFSLPRLLLPRGDRQQQQKPLAAAARHDLQEQHSPTTTTTSAYGTGGTDTGQESPEEKQRQQQQKATTSAHSTTAEGKQQQQQQHKSVKFDLMHTRTGSAQLLDELPQLPAGLFYTSAERLAQTLELQKRLLREELLQQTRAQPPHPQQSAVQQTLADVPVKRPPVIRVPASPLRTIPVPMPSSTSPMVSPPSFVQQKMPMQKPQFQPAAAKRLPEQQQNTTNLPPLIGGPKSKSSSSSVLQLMPTTPSRQAQQKQQQTQMKPTELDHLFAYKAKAPEHLRSERSSRADIATDEKKHVKGGGGDLLLMREAAETAEQRKQQELEWVVKRRPDGTRYVTRRPVRKDGEQQQGPCSWSAVVKARREQSLLRERHQSGAASTTTDDDGATGSELALASRLWMREQRRRHKGRGAEASIGSRRHFNNRAEWAAAAEQSDCINQQRQQQMPYFREMVPKAKAELRLNPSPSTPIQKPPQQQSGRGHSLPGQALFSVTTV